MAVELNGWPKQPPKANGNPNGHIVPQRGYTGGKTIAKPGFTRRSFSFVSRYGTDARQNSLDCINVLSMQINPLVYCHYCPFPLPFIHR